VKTLYLHIGLPKTGSSALQVWFAGKSAEFAAQGLAYPAVEDLKGARAGRITSGNAGLLARSLLPENDPLALHEGGRRVRQAFVQALRQAGGDVLLSSEMFVAGRDCTGPIVEAVRIASAEGFRTHLVLFARDQLSYLCALYIQRVKRHQHTGDASAFIGKSFPRARVLRYKTFCDSVASIDGVAGLTALAYSPDPEHSIFDRFRRALGCNELPLPEGECIVNTSLGLNELQLMLMLNRYRPRLEISDFIVEDAIAVRGSRPSMDVVGVCPPELREKVVAFFAEENAAFEKQYLKDGFRLCADARTYASIPYRDLSSAPDPQVVGEVFGGLLVRLDRRLSKLERIVTKAISHKNRAG